MVEIPEDRTVHQTSVKVRFYELDPYDHVNHTNYFSYFETARIELLAERGWGLDLMKQRGFQLVVVEAHARFLAAARYGEELEIFTWVESVGRVKSTWSQTMLRAGDEIARLRIDAAFTDNSGKPRRIPPEFAESMGALTGS